MAERDVPILQDTERVWILVILLGCLWLGPPLPGHVWIVLGATIFLMLPSFIPFGKEGLRSRAGFTILLTALAGLVVAQFSNAVVHATAGGWGEFGVFMVGIIQSKWALVLGFGVGIVMLAVGAILTFVRLPRCRIDLPGPSIELTTRGLLIPLVLCALSWAAVQNVDFPNRAIPARAAAVLLFLFHFYAFWPRRRWVSRWLWLIAVCLVAPSGSGMETFRELLVRPTELMKADSSLGNYLRALLPAEHIGGAVSALTGFIRMLSDFVRAFLSFDNPNIRGFFFGHSIAGLPDPNVILQSNLLKGLSFFEWGGMQLSPIVALCLPPLVALRLVGGKARARWLSFAVWSVSFCAVVMPLWGTLVDLQLYRPVFLADVRLVWFTQALPLHLTLLAALYSSLPLAAALSGQAAVIELQLPDLERPGAELPQTMRGRICGVIARVVGEETLLPPLCAILVSSGILGGICANVINSNLGTFHGTIDARPGQLAAGQILEPFFVRSLSTRMKFSEGLEPWRLHDAARRLLTEEETLPKEWRKEEVARISRDLVRREASRPEVRPYLTAFELAADADVLGWKVLMPSNHIAHPDFVNLNLAATLVSARALSAASCGDWKAASQDTRRLIRFGSLLGSEGNLVQRMMGAAISGKGTRNAFLLLQHCPKDQLGVLLADLRALASWVQPVATPCALEVAEPSTRWPNQLILPTILVPGSQRAAVADKCHVARFRLVLLACAARTYLCANSRLPGTIDDLQPLLGGPAPLDPFSGNDFTAHFTADRVCFSTAKDTLPDWLAGDAGSFLHVPGTRMLAVTVNAKGEVTVE